MKSPLKDLLADANLATQARGMKAALAEYLGVPRPRVSEWLRGVKEPGGAITLRIMEWVNLPEAQRQKALGSSTKTAKSKTRSTQSDYEKSKASPRPK